MNPYARFQVVSAAISGTLILAGFGFLSREVLTQPLTLQVGLAFGGLTMAAITIWYTINHQVMPLFLSQSGVRDRILGRKNIEGTWLQAERAGDALRISVINISPGQDGFSMTGYAMDEHLDVVSNMALEHAKLDWPFLSFKFRNTLVDAEDPAREGFGELQFEQSSARTVRFNGYCKMSGAGTKFSIEGVRLTDFEELEMLETLEGREDLVDKYWELFFEREQRREERRVARKAKRLAHRTHNPVGTAERDVAAVMATGPAGQLKSKVAEAFGT